MSSYLVTGGCGFIGSHLTEQLLKSGAKVIVLDNLSTGKQSNLPKAAQFILGDVGDEDLVTSIMPQVDGCFHLAAIASIEQSNQQWVQTHRTNLTGTINLFNAARPAKLGKQIPIVYASSAAVYGDNNHLPLNESEVPKPLTAYGADKYGCELHAAIAGDVHHIPTIGWRFFNVYGPRQDPTSPYSGVISIFFDHIANAKPIQIYGQGEQFRDFIYVSDVIQYLVKSIDVCSEQAQVFNACTGVATKINQLATTLQTIFATTVDIQHSPARIGDIPQSLGDPTLAKDRFGLQANTSLKEGLMQMAHFYGKIK